MVEAADLPHVDAGALKDMLPPAKTALVVVDIQTDFAAPHGLVGSFGADMTTVEAAIDRIETAGAQSLFSTQFHWFVRVHLLPLIDGSFLNLNDEVLDGLLEACSVSGIFYSREEG